MNDLCKECGVNEVSSRGLCKSCYGKLWRAGKLERKLSVAKGKVCHVIGCNKTDILGKDENGNHLCRRHYMRWYRNGNPIVVLKGKNKTSFGTTHDVKTGREICKVDGCYFPVRVRGLCHKHYLVELGVSEPPKTKRGNYK